jgi:hypothetical protein
VWRVFFLRVLVLTDGAVRDAGATEMPSGSPLAGLYSFELDPETEVKHDCDMFDLMEQGVGGSALKTLSPVPKAAPHSRCYVKRVRDDNGQILFHMYKEGGGACAHTLSAARSCSAAG